MAIRRAGPFGNNTAGWYQDQPVTPPSSADGGLLPINCAMFNSSTNWPWIVFVQNPSLINSYDLCPFGASSFSRTWSDPIFEGTGLYFRFQCADSIDIEIDYLIRISDNSAPQNFWELSSSILDQESGIVIDSFFIDSTSGSFASGSFTLTSTKAVLPNLFSVSASGESGNLVMTLTINFPN